MIETSQIRSSTWIYSKNPPIEATIPLTISLVLKITILMWNPRIVMHPVYQIK